MVVGWLSSGWTDGCVRMGQDKDGYSADEGLLSDGRWKVEKARTSGHKLDIISITACYYSIFPVFCVSLSNRLVECVAGAPHSTNLLRGHPPI